MKVMTVLEAKDFIESYEGFDDLAVRADGFIPEESFNNSWYHGDEEESFEYDGVSCVKVEFAEDLEKKIAKVSMYGKNIFLIAGTIKNGHEIYHDAGESLMVNNVIVAMITL